MENPQLLFLHILFLFTNVQTLDTDKLLLLSFKNAVLSDPFSILQKWKYDDASPCSWPGVGCFYLEQNGTGSSRVNSLSLPRSRLSGSLSPDLGIIEYLAYLDLSYNNFSGSVPIGFNRTEFVDLSSNLLEGVLPEEPYGGSARDLNFSYNKLSGAIPYQFARGVDAYGIVDISFNELSGAIPDSVALLNQKVTSFEGNSLCGKPLRVLCSVPDDATSIAPAMAVMPITESSKSKKGMKVSTVLIIVAADFSGVVIFAVFLFYLCHLRSTKASTPCCLKASEIQSPKKGGTLVMINEEMELDVESLFKSSAFILGSNRGSIVYKVVTADGRSFVVRRIGRNPEENFSEFKNRIKFLGKLKHHNLIRVHGFYWGDEEKLIVCDLVNSNLSNILTRPSSLSIESRFKIAKGITKGLAFLHDKKQVHGNVKPSNVLITSDFEAVVSDFGFSTQPGLSTVYRAPELVEKGKVNQKCDVFSFGVILLELLGVGGEMGKRVDESVELDLNRFGGLVECGLWDVEENREEMVVALKLGFKCVSVNPLERPSFKEALLILEKL